MNTLAILNSIIYAVLGVLIFCLTFFIVDLLTPYHLWKELVENEHLRKKPR